MDGVNAARKTIPFARFDRERTKQSQECLRSYRTEWDEKARAFKKTLEHNWASHGADAWRYLSLSWRAPMRKPEVKKVPIGLPLRDMTIDQFIDIEDGWTAREDRGTGRTGFRCWRDEGQSVGPNLTRSEQDQQQ
jgi:hypothetical protein